MAHQNPGHGESDSSTPRTNALNDVLLPHLAQLGRAPTLLPATVEVSFDIFVQAKRPQVTICRASASIMQ